MGIRFFIGLISVFCFFQAHSSQPELSEIRQKLEAKQGTSSKESSLEILNVSYDPTREFYEEYNPLFIKWWKERTGQDLSVVMSHAGSGKQARAVISGLEADVVSLALAFDIDSIEKMTGLVGKGWEDRLPHKSAPYYSTIVFLVRKGNPKKIKDWDDLAKEEIKVVLANPKTSGGARWAYMAAWGWALKKFNNHIPKVEDYMKKLFTNAPILDTGARGATTTFIQREMGDVLLTWENEAYLTLEKEGEGAFDIIYPTVSIQADPPVAWLDGILKEKGTEDVSRFYLSYLYSESAQKLIAKHYFRPFDEKILQQNKKLFPSIKMLKIEDLGGWEKVQEEHFKDEGLFDKAYLQSRG